MRLVFSMQRLTKARPKRSAGRHLVFAQCGERLWHWAAACPIKQFNRMYDWNRGTGSNLGDATNIAGSDHIRSETFNVRDFARTQLFGQRRLKNVVGTSRTATQMAFRHVLDDESTLAKQFLGFVHHFLPMLQRAG